MPVQKANQCAALHQAAKTAADVRTKVTLSFEKKDLTESFGKIELFLATFPGDENIRLASIDLVTCTLKAIELAISYYMSHTRKISPLTHRTPDLRANVLFNMLNFMQWTGFVESCQ